MMKLALFLLLILFFAPLVFDSYGESFQVPVWVKNTAKWWSEGKVGDSDFTKAMQYLIEHQIITVPKPVPEASQPGPIPAWVRNTAMWWSEGLVGDTDFIKGIQFLVDANIIPPTPARGFLLSSSAFENDTRIPVQYTCDGGGLSPPLEIHGVPNGTKSLALTLVDPDAPEGPFTHWTMWNIPDNSTSFGPGERTGFTEGIATAGTVGYFSPCPPAGVHRYVFTVYALDTSIGLSPGASRSDLENAIEGHVINSAILVGLYSKTAAPG